MEREAQSAVEFGLEAILGAFLLFSSVVLLFFGKQWYAEQQAIESHKEDIAIMTTAYAMTKRDVVYGSDIVEFIVKYGGTYNYTIDNGLDEPVRIGIWYKTDGTIDYQSDSMLFTEHRLTTIVFGDKINKKYFVTVNRSKDGSGAIDGFTFTLESMIQN